MTSSALSASLAAVTPSPSGTPEIDPSRVTPGGLGFLFLMFLVVAVFFLWRSMNKQLKRIEFDEPARRAPAPPRGQAVPPVDPAPVDPTADAPTAAAADTPAPAASDAVDSPEAPSADGPSRGVRD